MADAKSASSKSDTSSNIDALYQVKLLSALRSGDPAAIHPFLQEISKDRGKSAENSEFDTGAAALHLAVRCGSPSTVALLLSHRAISPNGTHPPGSGTTPLHLAASLGRVDIVNLLLEQENIDDNLRDAHGKTCRDVARGKDVIRAIDDSRAFLNASYRSLLRSYILSPLDEPPAGALIHLLESPRAKFLDLSYLDDDSGASLLHEAARRKDLRLIELAVRAGADVFVRNRKGKMAYEGAGKDDRVKVFLRQFANHDKTLIPNPTPFSEPPILKGYLNKYANVAKGYNTRWFVLKNGVLSYYRHQDDETVASRGSISMKNAVLRIGERTRFEVHSTPSRGSGHLSQSHAVQKWYMKANHPVEAHRWTEAVGKSIEWYRIRDAGATDSDASSININAGRRRSEESDSSFKPGSGGSHNFRLSSHILRRQPTVASQHASLRSQTKLEASETTAEPGLIADEHSAVGVRGNGGHQFAAGDEDDGDDEDDSSSSGGDSDRNSPPHPNWELQGNTASAQLELTQQLFINFKLPSDASSRLLDTHEALKETLATAQTLLADYLSITRERDEWHARQLRKERARQHVWEESLATVVREGESLEKELRTRSRKRGSRIFAPSPGGTITSESSHPHSGRRRPSILGIARTMALSPTVDELPTPTSDEPPPLTPAVLVSDADDHFRTTSPVPIVPPIPLSVRRTPIRSDTQETLPKGLGSPSPGRAGSSTPTKQPLQASIPKEDEDYEGDTDEEDEFFDAIESGNLPNLLVPESLASPTNRHVDHPPSYTDSSSGQHDLTVGKGGFSGPLLLSTPSTGFPWYMTSSSSSGESELYAGYTHLRSKLALRADERPSTSLWSVLKNSIGKDLTKISFPVHFNEPTSMLQRMAEDMEFSECLDVAAQEKDPLRRIAFVAAFAMSNYSSTIGRIAKPFNPMLSETFEYVRLDKQYRYVSEQVSHHPPISACWSESPLWHYYGEVDAQNKFMGKSFEIRPTGIAHADLLLPEEDEPTYPPAIGVGSKGKVVEHYSWKKVTTNISGFILGSPTIDHYGDMVVTNHRTGDQCILTFKPRGWRGKDAYEISGQVIDSSGDVAYEIAGRWNSQLVARRVGFGSGVLNPDMSVSGPQSPSSVPEYILLWRNSDKPTGTPFNLTPFAMTLNDCPQKTLRPVLAPTDCRLRVDQRAFELGRYELANELKQAQEEKQRSMRRAREEGRLEMHKPRWFVAETEVDTGERVWNPLRAGEGKSVEYWVERERVWKEHTSWNGVEDIFIQEPTEIKELVQKTLQ